MVPLLKKQAGSSYRPININLFDEAMEHVGIYAAITMTMKLKRHRWSEWSLGIGAFPLRPHSRFSLWKRWETGTLVSLVIATDKLVGTLLTYVRISHTSHDVLQNIHHIITNFEYPMECCRKVLFPQVSMYMWYLSTVLHIIVGTYSTLRTPLWARIMPTYLTVGSLIWGQCRDSRSQGRMSVTDSWRNTR